MRLLDTDVMIDILRQYPPAIKWFASLRDVAPGLPGLVVIELMAGCQNRQEMAQLQKDLTPFRIYWPTEVDCKRALVDFPQGHLSSKLGIVDVLIGECAVGLNATLCTFNTKHFKAIPTLKTE